MLMAYVETKGREATNREVISALVDEGLRAAAEAAAYPSNVNAILSQGGGYGQVLAAEAAAKANLPEEEDDRW